MSTPRKMPEGIPFGDPRHPWKQNSVDAKRASLKGRARSPWGKFTYSPRANSSGAIPPTKVRE